VADTWERDSGEVGEAAGAGVPPARDLSGPGTTVPGSRAAGPRRCGRCGVSLPGHFHFCGTCGFNLDGDDDGGLAYRDPLIGVVVGDRYRLLGRIGVGGMGTVYKAEHVRMGKVVAVKLLHGDLSRDVAMIRRFTREARAASRLSSPHTVSVFDYGQSEGLVYLVMEYLHGSDLGQILRTHGPLGLTTTARVLAQVAASLEEAHTQGIIHRDLKPENIFVCASEIEGDPELVKVLDFGLAKLRATRDDSLVSTAHGAALIGTPYYMSPEQISGKEVDVRSDLYSLAAVVFKMLTGHPPYEHENPVAVLSGHLTARVPVPSDYDPLLQPVDSTVRRALAKRPADRFASVSELSEAFTRAVIDPSARHRGPTTLEIRAVSPEDTTTRAEFDRFELRLRARRMGKVLLALVLLGGAVGALWWGVVEGNFFRSKLESEPNDTPGQATRLFLDEPIRGTIGLPATGQRADDDYYLVENDTGHPIELSVDLSGVPGLDLVLRAFDADLQEPVVSNTYGEGSGESIPNLYVGGRYAYVHVRELWVRDRPPRYNPDVPYTLVAHARTPSPSAEVEPNERIARAMPLTLDEPVTGLIGWAGDLDLYRAPDLPQHGKMVTVVAEGEVGVDLELRFLDVTGQELFRSNRAPLGQPERVTFFAAPANHGVLFVGVSAADSPARDPVHPYRLTISFADVEPLSPPADLLDGP
jgi:hypothetical protein